MKTLTQTKTLTIRDSHLLPYAKALLNYAKSDQDFASALVQKITEQNFKVGEIDSAEVTSVISITEQVNAVETFNWLLKECDHQTPYTVGLLTEFAESHKTKKDFIVMGLGMTVVPGLTVGNPSIKKRHKGQLQVFISETLADNLETEKLAELVSEEGQGVLARELKIAGGNITRLHPDSAEWLMSDPATEVSAVEQDVLADIAKVIESEKLSGRVKRNGSVIEMVAVSPAVPDSVTEDLV